MLGSRKEFSSRLPRTIGAGMLGPLVYVNCTQMLPSGMFFPWITLRDSKGTPSALTVLFSTYATRSHCFVARWMTMGQLLQGEMMRKN